MRERYREDGDVPWLDAKGYLRVSSLADMCPREEVLCATEQIVRKKVVDTDLNLIFAHGKSLHWGLQNEVLGSMGILLGVWRCVDCAKQYGQQTNDVQTDQALVRKPLKCECGCPDFTYRECHFINEEFRIGGHPDGFLVLPGMPGMGIIECKSIGSRRSWEVRQVPQMSHAIQTQAYMWLTGLKWAKILYWDKGGQGLTALIEHTLERDEDTISKIKSTIRSVWNGIESGLLPARICETSSCPRAAKCQVTGLCFSKE